MEVPHEIHVPASAVLDNSHYVSETLVSTNAPTVQPIFALGNRLLTSNSLIQPLTPSTRGRLLNEDFVDFQYGDIHASAAQITTRRIMTEQSPQLATSPSPSHELASQGQLLQLRSQSDAAELMAKTAEADARTAICKQARDSDNKTDGSRRVTRTGPGSRSPSSSPKLGMRADMSPRLNRTS